jgi:hypothetical protein
MMENDNLEDQNRMEGNTEIDGIKTQRCKL